jgi:hypothetical protein
MPLVRTVFATFISHLLSRPLQGFAAGLLTFLFQQLFLQSQSLLSPHSDVIRVAHVSSIHLVSGGQAGSD